MKHIRIARACDRERGEARGKASGILCESVHRQSHREKHEREQSTHDFRESFLRDERASPCVAGLQFRRSRENPVLPLRHAVEAAWSGRTSIPQKHGKSGIATAPCRGSRVERQDFNSAKAWKIRYCHCAMPWKPHGAAGLFLLVWKGLLETHREGGGRTTIRCTRH